jgi:hypothetical protein
MRPNPNRGRVYCRGADGRRLGARCPQLANPRHGSWAFAVDLPSPDHKRTTTRRSGYDTRSDARAALAKALECQRAGVLLDDAQTVADYLTGWLDAKARTLKPTTLAATVPGLLHGPGRRRMRGDPGDVQSACAVFEEHQRIYPAQVDQVDMDEVAGDDALGLRGQELAPGRAAAAWGRIDAGRRKDLPDRRGADAMPEADKFALDATTAPARILLGQPQHQFLHRAPGRRLPGLRRRVL